MERYRTEPALGEEPGVICDGLIGYNRSRVPFLRKEAFVPVNLVIRDEQGVAAGILGEIYCWDCMSVEVLWVREDCRGRGMGSALLQEAERIAREKNCGLIHLDTFDFQAKDFYENHGYQVFGVLEDCPGGHSRFYMKKKL